MEDKRAGKFPAELDKPYIDKDASLSWLKKGKLTFDGERKTKPFSPMALKRWPNYLTTISVAFVTLRWKV